MTISEAFAEQLAATVPSTGVYYLPDNTVEGITKYLTAMYESTNQKVPTDITEQAKTKLTEHADHVGQRQVYFMVKNERGLEILKAWEADIDQLEKEYALMDPAFSHPGSALPRLQKKETK